MTQRSGLKDFISSSASGVFQLFGWCTGRPFSLANSLSGSSARPGLVRRAEHGDDVLPALEQLLEHGLAEGLLSMHDDAH